jgi:23S rRNA (uridine2552-2'-O)-methyltransferase
MNKQDYERGDFWSKKAAEDGYPARSVYKLEEIDKKFGLLPNGRVTAGRQKTPLKALDLGAAPGSWSLYLLRKTARLPCGSFVLTACDLTPLSNAVVPDFFLRGDMTDDNTKAALLERGPYSLVLSDAAPATSGNRSLDTLRSLALAEAAFFYAEKGLEKGGSFIVKIFQGGETASFLNKLKPLFATVKTFKPKACRPSSFETYCIARGFAG